MTNELQKALQAYGEKMAKGLPGSIRSPHEADLYCDGFKQALELMTPLIEALEFYASGEHIHDLQADLENPSGETGNWVCDSDDKFNLENGGFARKAFTDLRKKVGAE